jgi:hypothetical protein
MAYLRGFGEEPMWYGVGVAPAVGLGSGYGDFTTEGTEDTEKKGKRAALLRWAKKSAGIKASATFRNFAPGRAQAGMPASLGYLAALAFAWLKARERRDL